MPRVNRTIIATGVISLVAFLLVRVTAPERELPKTPEMVVAAQAQRVIRMMDGRIIDDRRVDSAFRDELLESRMKEVPKATKPGT